MLRAATSAGERGRLPCRAQSAPRPKFYWSRGGQSLNVNQTSKYYVEYKQIDSLTYESILLIERVASNDYGQYECTARNELGSVKELVRLDVTSPPDPPLSLNILNATHDSVTVAWTPGFDGGMKANYRIRYREANNDHYRYEDSLANSHKLTITGLRMNTLYLFSVMASNALGSSKYLPDLTRAQTKGNVLRDDLPFFSQDLNSDNFQTQLIHLPTSVQTLRPRSRPPRWAANLRRGHRRPRSGLPGYCC